MSIITNTEESSASLGDAISNLCIAHYSNLPKKGKPAPNQWTVLSAIVMETSGSLSVITMATGTKCVGEKQKSEFVVSDSHAEILCLRLFRLFLLKDIQQCLDSSKYSQPGNEGCQNGDGICLKRVSGEFKLKSDVRFHLYSSCVMCGDAAISNTDKSYGNDINLETRHRVSNDYIPDSVSIEDNLSKRTAPSTPVPTPKRPKLETSTRTGAKSLLHDNLVTDSLSGRSWHVTHVLRSKPGRGPISLSLSCSDKIMKRQFLGLQGGVLAKLLSQPIRFSSVTIAGDFSEGSVKRALFERLPSNDVPHPTLFRARDDFPCSQDNIRSRDCRTPRDDKHGESRDSSSSSVLWLRTAKGSEHWVAVKGKLQGATKGCHSSKYMVPVCRAGLLQQVNLVTSLLQENAQTGLLFSTSVESGTLPECSVLEQYRSLKLGSWYSQQKKELKRHFEGWDRKTKI